MTDFVFYSCLLVCVLSLIASVKAIEKRTTKSRSLLLVAAEVERARSPIRSMKSQNNVMLNFWAEKQNSILNVRQRVSVEAQRLLAISPTPQVQTSAVWRKSVRAYNARRPAYEFPSLAASPSRIVADH